MKSSAQGCICRTWPEDLRYVWNFAKLYALRDVHRDRCRLQSASVGSLPSRGHATPSNARIVTHVGGSATPAGVVSSHVRYSSILKRIARWPESSDHFALACQDDPAAGSAAWSLLQLGKLGQQEQGVYARHFPCAHIEVAFLKAFRSHFLLSFGNRSIGVRQTAWTVGRVAPAQ